METNPEILNTYIKGGGDKFRRRRCKEAHVLRKENVEKRTIYYSRVIFREHTKQSGNNLLGITSSKKYG